MTTQLPEVQFSLEAAPKAAARRTPDRSAGRGFNDQMERTRGSDGNADAQRSENAAPSAGRQDRIAGKGSSRSAERFGDQKSIDRADAETLDVSEVVAATAFTLTEPRVATQSTDIPAPGGSAIVDVASNAGDALAAQTSEVSLSDSPPDFGGFAEPEFGQPKFGKSASKPIARAAVSQITLQGLANGTDSAPVDLPPPNTAAQAVGQSVLPDAMVEYNDEAISPARARGADIDSLAVEVRAARLSSFSTNSARALEGALELGAIAEAADAEAIDDALASFADEINLAATEAGVDRIAETPVSGSVQGSAADAVQNLLDMGADMREPEPSGGRIEDNGAQVRELELQMATLQRTDTNANIHRQTQVAAQNATQIAATIAASRSSDEISVQMDPPELGALQIKFNFGESGVLFAHLSFDNDSTRALMRANEGELRAALADAGFPDAQLEYSQNGQGGDRTNDQAPKDDARGYMVDLRRDPSNVLSLDQPRRYERTRIGLSGVDIRA